MKKIFLLLLMISSFSFVFAKNKFIGVIDIVPGDLSSGEPALILGKNEMLVAQVMGDDHFKILDMFGKVKQIGKFSVLNSNGTIYLWIGNFIYDKSSEVNWSQHDVVKLPDRNYEIMAESRFKVNSLVMAKKNGEVFYLHMKPSSFSTINASKIELSDNIHKIIDSGSAVTALAVSDVGDVSKESIGNAIEKDFYKSIFVVATREDKSIELAMKRTYPKIEASEFSVCKLPDTPDVVKKVFLGDNGVSVLLKNGKIAYYSGFECPNDTSQYGKWHYYRIGTTDHFIDIDSHPFTYSALGSDRKMYICEGNFEDYGLVPSKRQITEKMFNNCQMRKSPIKDGTHIRYNGVEVYLIDSKGNFYFWDRIGDNFDFQRPPSQRNHSKCLKEQ